VISTDLLCFDDREFNIHADLQAKMAVEPHEYCATANVFIKNLYVIPKSPSFPRKRESMPLKNQALAYHSITRFLLSRG
jgi:hypothetical protein